MQLEKRFTTPTIQAQHEADRIIFSGYVFQFDSLSEDLGGFREVIRRGATTKALSLGTDIQLITDHSKDCRNVLASTAGQTLVLAEDNVGLAFIAQAANTQTARDLYEVLRDNKLGVSFSFTCTIGQQRTKTPDGQILRAITSFDLIDEISLVVDPAYRSSSVSAVMTGPVQLGSDNRAAKSIEFMERELQLAEVEASLYR
jgi:uncharacterized protein